MIYGKKTHDGLTRPLLPAALAQLGSVRTARQPDGTAASFVCVLVVIEHPPVPESAVRPFSLADEGRWFAWTKRWMGADWLLALDRAAELSARADEMLAGTGPWGMRRVAQALAAAPEAVLSPLHHLGRAA